MGKRQRGKMGNRRGFTLVEVAVGTVLLGIGGATLQPLLFGSRGVARDNSCKMNMLVQGQMYAAYSADNAGLIASFTWQGGETYPSAWSNLRGPHFSDWSAAQAQVTDLLRRNTGRDVDTLPNNIFTYPQRRYTHLVLLDASGTPAPQELFACPEDAPLLASRADPLDSSLWATTSIYNTATQFATVQVRTRYPFSSTYQTIPNASAPEQLMNGRALVAPNAENSHLFPTAPASGLLGRRPLSEVAFPSLKVHLFEHNDFHRNAGDPFYAYDQAECNQLFFDGSVDDLRSADAEPGWDPCNPTSPDTFYYRYTPLSTEPIPLGDPEALLPVRYRFTREGLAGFDYQSRLRFLKSPNRVPR